MSTKTPKSPQEVIEMVDQLVEENRERAVHLSRLKMWAQVGLQGLTPDVVRAFSTREEHIRESYQSWLRGRGQLSSSSMQGRLSVIGMSGGPTPEDPEWVRHCGKSRHGRYEGRVYTVAILKDGSEVRLDPPIVMPAE